MKSLIHFLSDLRARDVSLSINGDKLTISAPKEAVTAEIKKELSERKEEILNFLRGAQGWKASSPNKAATELPLSRAQQRLWFMGQLDPESPSYNIVVPLWMEGDLNVDALDRALQKVVERHESLRTGFLACDGQPFTRISETVDWKLDVSDLRHLGSQEAEEEAKRLGWHAGRWLFDLSKAPLFRASLFRVADGRYLFVPVVHHIVADGWSLGVVSREMTAFYKEISGGSPASLPAMNFQFRDYVQWEQGEGQRLADQQMPYWLDRLQGNLSSLEIPTDHQRLAVQSFHGRRCEVEIDGDLADCLRAYSRERGATLFTVLVAAFKVLLYRYTGREDILVGSNTANRPREEFSSQVGFFVNNVVLRTDLSGEPTFHELVDREKETTRQAYAHQNVPFDLLVEKLRPERALNHHSPLVQVMFTLENVPLPDLDLPGVRTEHQPMDFQIAGADIAVLAWPKGKGYRCEFEYSTDLFDEEMIHQIQRHYVRLLREVVKDGSRSISALPLLSEDERAEILQGWNGTASGGPSYATVVEWFREQAGTSGDAVAIEMGDRVLSYSDLDQLSDRAAGALHGRGARRGALVGLFMDRSVEMVVWLLGILKAGAAYLPLDPAFPAARIEYLVKDSGVSLIVTEENLLADLPASEAEVLMREGALDEDFAEMQGEQATQDDLAYVIYTSGSTGQPKGTEVPHKALVNLLGAMIEKPGLKKNDTFVAVTTLSFDIAGLELFGPLVSGAKLVLASREQALDPMALAALIDQTGCTVLQATPSTWRMLFESGWMGKSDLRMWCGGEALSVDLADSLLTRGQELWNLYGPTETTIWSAAHRVKSGEDPILIGRPIANTRMYILDGKKEPVPVGVTGELYIAGKGVAHGYRNREELTAERFVPEIGNPIERMYRTGDLARYRRDGQIQLLGRTDEQIKLRGHRVEPGEIEAVLEKHLCIQQALVTAQQDRLVAYVRGRDGEIPASELRNWLHEHLPEYMIPGQFVFVEEFPLTPNGKIDRKQLLAVKETTTAQSRTESPVPRTETEERLAGIWSRVLDRNIAGVRDNFFDLGGHSLLLIRVHVLLREEFGVDIPVLDLFRYTTIEALAVHLNRQLQPAIAGGVYS